MVKDTKKQQYLHFDGPCPLLMCLADFPHEHPICPKCKAVGYGNICCEKCRKSIDIHRELSIIELQAR